MILLAILLLVPLICSAQDSTQTSDSGRVHWYDAIDVNFRGAHYYQSSSHGPVEWPAILGRRRSNLPNVSDNPLQHGATYLAVDAMVHPYPGIRLHGELVGENRGISYGVNNTSNMIAFPRMAFIIDSTFTLLGQSFDTFLQVGDTVGLRFDEGLLFYNMDGQGAIIRLGWKNLGLHLEHIGDVDYGLGLNINDARSYGVSYSGIGIADGWLLGLRASRVYYYSGPINPFQNGSPRARLYDSVGLQNNAWSFSAHLAGNSARVYMQTALRNSVVAFDPVALGSLLVGATASGDWGDLQWDGRVEYRFYGGLFNAGHHNDRIRFRADDGDRNPVNDYGNTIGDFLYPLSNLERPFSQWAMFTEYQEMKDVLGVTATLNLKYRIWAGIVARCMLDFNYIRSERTDGFLYPFYDVGLGWEPFDNISVIVSMTNRAMNLDKGYPTYYLRSTPARAYTIRWNIP